MNVGSQVVPILLISLPTTQRSLSLLPVEVWEQVIDRLVIGYTTLIQTYQDNLDLRRDLSSCALVCRGWRVRAQMHLFAFLRISGDRLSQYETLILKTPVLCDFAKELKFYNQYINRSKCQIADKTVETVSHAVRIAHKLCNVHYLNMHEITLAIEHPHLPRHVAALTRINQLHFFSATLTKLSQLARILISFKNLSTLLLKVPIVVDSNPLPLPRPCYVTKSSLTVLDLVIQPGGHLLVDWLVKAKSFTTSLQVLFVVVEHQIPQSEVAPLMQGVQSLLDNCTGSLKEWELWANFQVDNLSSVPKGKMALKFHLHLLMFALVSLGSHKSLSQLRLRISKVWFKHALEQLASISSNHITQIQLFYWLDKEERPSDEFWNDTDKIVSKEFFKSLLSARISCRHRTSDNNWRRIDGFDYSQLPDFLPKIHKKGILCW